MEAIHPKNLEQLKFYDRKNPGYMEYSKNIPYIKYLAGKILPEIPGSRNHILEVGAGQGRVTFELARHAGKITATDISRHEIGMLNGFVRQNRISNVTGEVHDLLNIEKTLKKQKYDHIIGVFILHHLPKNELPRVVSRLLEYLRPGGRLTFLESNNVSPATLLAILVRKDMTWEVEKGTYTNWVSIFKKACVQAGMKLMLHRKFGFFPPEIINRYPKIVKYDRIFESIPLLSQFLCMYQILSFEKSYSF